MDLDEKLQKLKSKDYLAEQIQEWESDLESNRLWTEYKDLECSKRLAKALNLAIDRLKTALVEEDDQYVRAGLKKDKARCEWLLHFYTEDYKLIKKGIEESINETLGEEIL